MKKLTAVALTLILAGCATSPQYITKEKLTVVEPDKNLYICSLIAKYPNPETLTDVEVAKLLLNYETTNSECRRNMKAIQSFINQAKKKTEEKQ